MNEWQGIIGDTVLGLMLVAISLAFGWLACAASGRRGRR